MKWWILLLFLCSASTQAQNLVPNPGFEKYRHCPTAPCTNAIQFDTLVHDWESVGAGSAPDYFHTCGNEDARVPDNWAGVADPVEGKGYVGLFTYNRDKNDLRDYLQVQLMKPLEKGKTYTVGFSFRLSTYSKVLSDELGIYFSANKIVHTVAGCIPAIPQVTVKVNNITNTDLVEWEALRDTMVAEGGENYIVIGNFKPNIHCKGIPLITRKTQEVLLQDKAYYYLDDIIVEEKSKQFVLHQVFTMNEIYFENNRFALPPTALPDLQKLCNYMRRNKNLILQIYGHTDAVGTKEANMKLSQNRARSVGNYLITCGIEPMRIRTFSQGSGYPKATTGLEEDKATNRRVTFVLSNQ